MTNTSMNQTNVITELYILARKYLDDMYMKNNKFKLLYQQKKIINLFWPVK